MRKHANGMLKLVSASSNIVTKTHLKDSNEQYFTSSVIYSQRAAHRSWKARP